MRMAVYRLGAGPEWSPRCWTTFSSSYSTETNWADVAMQHTRF